MDPLSELDYSVSPYAYCRNNPVNLVDPWGLAAQDNDNPVLGGKGTEEDPYRKQGIVVTPKGNYPEGYYFVACFGSVEDRTGKPISEQMMRQQGSKSDAMELERLEAEAAKLATKGGKVPKGCE